MPATKILVIEDEAKIAQILVDYLERDGYQTHVLLDGTDAIATIKTEAPALILLDLMLPGKDGLTICREVRQFSDIPIMMLTAKIDEIDRLIGLELGADDYVCKPFSPREVIARVKVILRRSGQGLASQNTDNELHYLDVKLNLDRLECTVKDSLVVLTPVEFRLLQGLMSRPGHVFTRERLMNLAYTDERVVSDRTIDTHIKNLRKKLQAAMNGTDIVHSIYSIGYKIS